MLMSCRRQTSRRQDKGIVNFRRKEVSASLFFRRGSQNNTMPCHLGFSQETLEDLKKKEEKEIHIKSIKKSCKSSQGNTGDIYNV